MPDSGLSQSNATPGRVYSWRYTESGDVVVTEKDAREFMDRGDDELTEEHWKRAARYLAPEHLEHCLDLTEWRPERV